MAQPRVTDAAPSRFETEFTSSQQGLVCLEGATSEESCGGTGLTVYLEGTKVRHLDWTVEMSNRFVRREYYYEGRALKLVVETIHSKYDAHGDAYPKPHFLSARRYFLDSAKPNERHKEFLEHADFLIRDFQMHRKDFNKIKALHAGG